MPDDGEKFPLSERILQAFTALSHWARIGESGCGNPLTWVKVVVLLLVVVLCPLFFLPIDQLLRDAARMACLIIFAAMTTGDEQAIRRLAIPSFWSTVFGRWVKTSAHDARGRRARGGPDGQAARQARLPLDYQASAPELIDLAPGSPQRARVRVSFSQLMAMIAPGAAGQAAMAAATSLSSLAGSFGQAMGQRMDGAPAGLDWLSWDGQYDLAFTRPAGSRTDPSAALASRTCAACGRAYRSELATACEYCKAERPTPWGQWRLANVTVVDE